MGAGCAHNQRMSLHPALLFLGGLVIIVAGAELLLRGATRLATLLRVPPVIIGLTVVTMGTTMPELAVGVTAALEGQSGLVVGNIAGTNVFNILVILGLSAAVRPLPLHLLSFTLDVPVMIGAALTLIVLASDGVLGRTDGSLLLIAALSYTLAMVLLSRRESAATRRDMAEAYGHESTAPTPDDALRSRWARALWYLALLGTGILVMLLGAELLVSGAVSMFDGQVTVFLPGGRRFADLYPVTPDAADVPSCEAVGVLGAVTGVIGTLMAMEAIKLVTGIGEPLLGRVLLYDGKGARFSEFDYA